MNSNESHQTTNQATPSTSTHATGTTERTTKLDSLPDEILLIIAEFTGAHSCYLGYGVVNKRINKLFSTYSNKLSKKTSYGGYARFQDILQECETELEKEIDYESFWIIPDIFHQLASGVVTFNRENLLEWALEIQNEYIFQAICERAITDGKLLIIERVWDSIRDETLMAYMKESTHFACIAAKKGDLESLKYLNEHGYEWNHLACASAAGGGHLDCLVYLHEQGCPWNGRACTLAACNGHLDCLVYLHERGCEWSVDACSEAARGGHLDCLVYLHEHGCEWDDEACDEAAREGHLHCLKYLHEQGCEWDDSACNAAASEGHLDCLIYLHEQGCPRDECACSSAACGGNLDCLKYLHNHGCEWNERACLKAAREGHLDCLVYLHEQGCPWNEDACEYAARYGHRDCLTYMRENGLKWDRYDVYLDSTK